MGKAIQTAITSQRLLLRSRLVHIMEHLADDCARVWPERLALEQALIDGREVMPYCKYLYVLDATAKQLTANISQDGLLEDSYGRERAERPYMKEVMAGEPFSLSQAYISRNARRPSLTALQQICNSAGERIGFLGADFDLRDLPVTREVYDEPAQWRQIKGDPAIRSGLFLQQRAESAMDKRINEVLDLIVELVEIHGVFHAKLHFSSSRATLWLLDDPFRYRILDIDDLTDPDICMAWPHHAYPSRAVIPAERVREVFTTFRDLRFMDETIYLRAGSLNIYNGLVGLNFSCDGSHYMPWEEFLDKNMGFWLGSDTSELDPT